MIIKHFNKDNVYQGIISSVVDLKITEELSLGYKTMSFSVPYSEYYTLTEEDKIETNDYSYVIKEANINPNGYYNIYCKPNYSKLNGKNITNLSGYNYSFSQAIGDILKNTDWTYSIEENIYGVYFLSLSQKTALEAIQLLKDLFNAEIYFDTKNKVVKVWNKRGSFKDTFLINAMTLKDCKIQSNSYDLITRLIPIGKDGISIAQVNKNCMWIEDFSYTDEVILGYYVDEKCVSDSELIAAAAIKLKEVSKPYIAYNIKTRNITTPLSVGDTIKVIDTFKKTDSIQRVKKIVCFPNKPENNYVELGDVQVLFQNIFKNLNDAQSIINENTRLRTTMLVKKSDSLQEQTTSLEDKVNKLSKKVNGGYVI